MLAMVPPGIALSTVDEELRPNTVKVPLTALPSPALTASFKELLQKSSKSSLKSRCFLSINVLSARWARMATPLLAIFKPAFSRFICLRFFAISRRLKSFHGTGVLGNGGVSNGPSAFTEASDKPNFLATSSDAVRIASSML